MTTNAPRTFERNPPPLREGMCPPPPPPPPPPWPLKKPIQTIEVIHKFEKTLNIQQDDIDYFNNWMNNTTEKNSCIRETWERIYKALTS